MAIRINTNTLSITAQRNLGSTAKAFQRSLERLASGSRINRAGDDAAGLAIGTGLEAQMRGLLRGVQNINEANGFLATAEGTIGVQVDMVQRMRELAISAANGTLGDQDRGYLNEEFQLLLEEYTRLANGAEFSGMKLLDGSFSGINVQVGTEASQTIELSVGSTAADEIFKKTQPSGEFEEVNTGYSSTFSKALQFEDFNNDGHLDILEIDGSLDGNIYLGDGSGNFSLAYTSSSIREGTLGDVNGDGNIDLVTGWGSNAEIFLGNGDGTFAAPITYAAQGGDIFDDETLFDYDGDGDLDLAVVEGNSNSQIYIFNNDGEGTFSFVQTIATGSNTLTIESADFNNDGLDDLVRGRSGPSGAVYISNGDASFSNNALASGGSGRVITADVNEDGYLDVISGGASNSSEIYVNLGNGDGSFLSASTFAASNVGSSGNGSVVSAADLNDDGHIDIVRSNGDSDSISIFYGRGNGSFEDHVELSFSSETNGVPIGDLNEDGFLDIGVELRSGGDRLLYQGSEEASAVGDLRITSQSEAQDVLEILDEGINRLLQIRAGIGAYQNRLEAARANTQSIVENIALAKSRILDTDIAEETAELARTQILQQAGVSVLTQANTSAQIALALLNF